MAVDHIRYDILTQEALRGVVRTVLVDTAKHGLPGEHHFYISFDTRADGVRVSPRMLAQYPEEMTVVLQHQFWDLVVTETGFEVGVSFGGVPERLSIPFAAVTGFFDPSVEFGLKFAEVGETGSAAPDEAHAGNPPNRPPADHPIPPSAEQRIAVPAPANAESKPASDAAPSAAEAGSKASTGGPSEKPSGEVVRLDRFRKK
jgi:uncharacterized protein